MYFLKNIWHRGIGQRGRWEGGSGWGIRVKPWLILVNVWQKPLQDCKVISLQLIKKKGKKKKKRIYSKMQRWVQTWVSSRELERDSIMFFFDHLLLVFWYWCHGGGRNTMLRKGGIDICFQRLQSNSFA